MKITYLKIDTQPDLGWKVSHSGQTPHVSEMSHLHINSPLEATLVWEGVYYKSWDL